MAVRKYWPLTSKQVLYKPDASAFATFALVCVNSVMNNESAFIQQDFLFLERIYKEDCLKHLSASAVEKVTEKLVNNVCIDNQ